METQAISQERKPLLIEGVLLSKCPHCRKGSLFANANPYIIKDIYKMNDSCIACSSDLRREPGFYWGAMYVSYALMVAFSFVDFMIFYWSFGWLTHEFMIINTLLMILISPLIFRISRSCWMYLFGDLN